MSEKGMKYDYGKVRPSLVLVSMKDAITLVSEVGTFGAEKYDDDNWKHVYDGEKRYLDAALRHILADGNDEESGRPHLAHAAWNLLALLQLQCDKKKPVPFRASKEEEAPKKNPSLPTRPVCKTCGETMEGDGYSTVLHCPNFEGDLNRAPDSNPIYCQGVEHGH